MTNITIPNRVTSIDRGAFYDCSELKNVTILGNPTTLSKSVFNGCTNLSSIVIPMSVKKIEEGAFSRCYSLKDVHYGAHQQQWNDITIEGDNDLLLGASLTYSHSFGNVWTSDANGHWYACSGCEQKSSYAAHTPGAAATATEDQVCTVCGYVMMEATGETEPATQATEPTGTDATQPESTPVAPTEPTGNDKPQNDSSFVWIIVVVAVVVLGGGAAAGVIIWKKKH